MGSSVLARLIKQIRRLPTAGDFSVTICY